MKSSALNKKLLRAAKEFISSKEPAHILEDRERGPRLLSDILKSFRDTQELEALPDALTGSLVKRSSVKSKKGGTFGSGMSFTAIAVSSAVLFGIVTTGVSHALSVLTEKLKSGVSKEDLDAAAASAEEQGKDVSKMQLKLLKADDKDVYAKIRGSLIQKRTDELARLNPNASNKDITAIANREFDEYESTSSAHQTVSSPYSSIVNSSGGISDTVGESHVQPRSIRPSHTVSGRVSVPRALVASDSVSDSLAFASRTVGVPLAWMYGIAHKESALGAHTSSGTSSARGMFQFINSTWNDMVSKYGTSVPGHFFGKDDVDKVEASALAGAFYIKENIAALKKFGVSKIGATEVYLAHFLGPRKAARFLKLILSGSGSVSASAIFTKESASNRPVFYNKDGTPRSISDVYAYFSGSLESLVSQYADKTGTTQQLASWSEDYNRYSDMPRAIQRRQTEAQIASAEDTIIQHQNEIASQRSRLVGSSIDESSGMPIVPIHEAFA